MYLPSFWTWYERHYRLNISIVAILFILQIFHLYWLSAVVVASRLTDLSGLWSDFAWLEIIITLVDYAEIPALITTSLVYISDLRRGSGASLLKPWLYLFMLNSQWLHIFWITDEFVIAHFIEGGEGTILPHPLAWAAIVIDYLELPVIADLFVKLFRALKRGDLKTAAEELRSH